MELIEYFDKVKDQEYFQELSRALQADKEDEDQKEHPFNRYSHGVNGWKKIQLMVYLNQ